MDSKAKFESLTALRGLLALWVVLFHFRSAFESLFPIVSVAEPFLEVGNLAVPGFFILSGFVLALNYLESFRKIELDTIIQFWLLRLARIYPVHIATIIAVAVAGGLLHYLGLLDNLAPYSLSELLRNVLLVHMWRPVAKLSWNYPSWSISSEWFAYLLFPVLARLWFWSGARDSRTVSAMFFLASIMSGALYYANGPKQMYFGVVCVVPFFVCGMSIWTFLDTLKKFESHVARAMSLALPIVIALICFLLSGSILIVIVILLLAALILSLAAAGARAHAIWGIRPLRMLGEASYSLYMTHAIVQVVLYKVYPAESFQDDSILMRSLVVLLYLLSIVIACAVCYFLVEKPSRVWLRQRIVAHVQGANAQAEMGRAG
jgi:peptidoglycan/LPS O-acetylase OafA/YrhL